MESQTWYLLKWIMPRGSVQVVVGMEGSVTRMAETCYHCPGHTGDSVLWDIWGIGGYCKSSCSEQAWTGFCVDVSFLWIKCSGVHWWVIGVCCCFLGNCPAIFQQFYISTSNVGEIPFLFILTAVGVVTLFNFGCSDGFVVTSHHGLHSSLHGGYAVKPLFTYFFVVYINSWWNVSACFGLFSNVVICFLIVEF